MRVLVAAQQLRRRVPGGIGRSAAELLRALALLDGVDVTLWAGRPARGAARERGESDLMASAKWPVRTSALPVPLLTAVWDRGLAAAPPGFDVVHSVSLAAPPVRRRGERTPVSTVTVHDVAWRRVPGSTTPRGRRWHEAALRRALRRGAHLVAPSLHVAVDLYRAGAAKDSVSVIPLGSDHLGVADEIAADAVLRRLGVHGEYLLVVGTLEPRKNLRRVLEAYRRVRSVLPEPWPLVVVGPEGWGEVAGSLAAAPMDGVKVAGAVPDGVLVGLYRRARLLAYVPLDEGFGLPPLEGMRQGLPCVASDRVPSVGADAWDTPVAVTADPYDTDAIARSLHVVATDDVLRERLIEAGHEMVAGRTWGETAEQYLSLWRRLA